MTEAKVNSLALQSLILQVLERDFEAGYGVSIAALAQHITERLMLEPTVHELPCLGGCDGPS